jgi:hypothetical protein
MKKIIAALTLGFLLVGVGCETTNAKKSKKTEEAPMASESTAATAEAVSAEDTGLKAYYKEQLGRQDLSPELRKYYEDRLKEESK